MHFLQPVGIGFCVVRLMDGAAVADGLEVDADRFFENIAEFVVGFDALRCGVAVACFCDCLMVHF